MRSSSGLSDDHMGQLGGTHVCQCDSGLPDDHMDELGIGGTQVCQCDSGRLYDGYMSGWEWKARVCAGVTQGSAMATWTNWEARGCASVTQDSV